MGARMLTVVAGKAETSGPKLRRRYGWRVHLKLFALGNVGGRRFDASDV